SAARVARLDALYGRHAALAGELHAASLGETASHEYDGDAGGLSSQRQHFEKRPAAQGDGRLQTLAAELRRVATLAPRCWRLLGGRAARPLTLGQGHAKRRFFMAKARRARGGAGGLGGGPGDAGAGGRATHR